jgi:hypothetical protein
MQRRDFIRLLGGAAAVWLMGSKNPPMITTNHIRYEAEVKRVA